MCYILSCLFFRVGFKDLGEGGEVGGGMLRSLNSSLLGHIPNIYV